MIGTVTSFDEALAGALGKTDPKRLGMSRMPEIGMRMVIVLKNETVLTATLTCVASQKGTVTLSALGGDLDIAVRPHQDTELRWEAKYRNTNRPADILGIHIVDFDGGTIWKHIQH